jgi:hypothetical protein
MPSGLRPGTADEFHRKTHGIFFRVFARRWDREEVREGLGVIVATVALLIVGLSILQARQPRPLG